MYHNFIVNLSWMENACSCFYVCRIYFRRSFPYIPLFRNVHVWQIMESANMNQLELLA